MAVRLTAVIDLILPCLDEAEALPWVLSRMPPEVRPIVVDNGSLDGSVEIAASLGATVVTCAQRGYGAACHAGLVAATSELVGFCDCDGSIDPAYVSACASLLSDGQVDLVVARRRPTTRRAWPVHARAANAGLTWWLRRRTDVRLHDVGPLRLGRRTALLSLEQTDRRSGYPLETLLLASRAGWRIAELDVAYSPRAGRSKVTGTVRGTVQAVHDMTVVLAR